MSQQRKPPDECREDQECCEDDDGDDEEEEEEEEDEDEEDENVVLETGFRLLHRTAMGSIRNAAQAMTGVLQIATTSQQVHHHAIRDLQRFAFETLGHFRGSALPPPPHTPRFPEPAHPGPGPASSSAAGPPAASSSEGAQAVEGTGGDGKREAAADRKLGSNTSAR